MFELDAVQFTLSQQSFFRWSMDNGAFAFIVLLVGFKVETNVGINESSVLIWIF